jgi:hypothetical protein
MHRGRIAHFCRASRACCRGAESKSRLNGSTWSSAASLDGNTSSSFCASLRVARNRVAGLNGNTSSSFCASLRVARNRVAKGGIEPPTHGFSAELKTYARLRHGLSVYDGSST